MTIQEFFDKYNGKGINFDFAYGNQCMDLYRQYVKDVLSLPQSLPVRGAKDVWTTYLTEHYARFENTPSAVPQRGDIIIWGVTIGTFGHIAIFDKGDVNSFVSFDQNFPTEGYYDSSGNFIGTGVCHFQTHNYNGVLGWIRAKNIEIPPEEPKITLSTKIPQIDNKEVQAIISDIKAKDGRIYELENQVDNIVKKKEAECNERVEVLKASLLKEHKEVLDEVKKINEDQITQMKIEYEKLALSKVKNMSASTLFNLALKKLFGLA